jgi:hypothetical protein
MPPKEGLHEHTPRLSVLGVMRAVRAPDRAAAAEASQPACPPPMTMTSYGLDACQSRAIEKSSNVIGAVLLLCARDRGKVSVPSIGRPYAGRMAPELSRSLGYDSLHVG